MNRAERLTAIVDLLAESGSLHVDDLVDRLGISPATARRDLDDLAAQRLLTRTRGGATAATVAYDLSTRYGKGAALSPKRAIAEAAADLIDVGDVIGLCGGTTSTALAGALATRAEFNQPGDQPSLTVVTNAINIAAQLAVRPCFKIMVTGGVLNPRSYELVGAFADHALRDVTIDKAFVGVNGIDPEVGPTITDEAEAVVNSALAARARTTYVIADASKIGRRAFATMPNFTFDHLITDDSITTDQLAALQAVGVDVVRATNGSARR